ncbi:hypothetical protein XA68_10683 [Ophiocordyceps unilateralis]|uniref:Elongation factor methyltransferase 7 n=1 Tax=Ophiocordyceps unilateralis TaxID=268505 RepID=A0A2A9PI38_OPHUN|nr:hypothetical protein XA68_10683 [Ophiocordyceps unilateralis]
MGSGQTLTLQLVGHSPTEAHHLWNGAKLAADYFEGRPETVRGKTVLELGAAAGLPSLVAALLGAERVVMTDFPDPELVAVMQRNIDVCDAQYGHTDDMEEQHDDDDDDDQGEKVTKGRIARTVEAVGFVWGSDPRRLTARLGSEATTQFDVIILADLLFRHSEHGALIKTISETLRRTTDSAAYVFFTSYRPWKQHLDMAFFDVARAAGFVVGQVAERKLLRPLFPHDPGDVDIQKTVRGFVVSWPG